MTMFKAKLASLISSPVFIMLAAAMLFGNLCGYLATRHADDTRPAPVAVDDCIKLRSGK